MVQGLLIVVASLVVEHTVGPSTPHLSIRPSILSSPRPLIHPASHSSTYPSSRWPPMHPGITSLHAPHPLVPHLPVTSLPSPVPSPTCARPWACQLSSPTPAQGWQTLGMPSAYPSGGLPTKDRVATGGVPAKGKDVGVVTIQQGTAPDRHMRRNSALQDTLLTL